MPMKLGLSPLFLTFSTWSEFLITQLFGLFLSCKTICRITIFMRCTRDREMVKNITVVKKIAINPSFYDYGAKKFQFLHFSLSVWNMNCTVQLLQFFTFKNVDSSPLPFLTQNPTQFTTNEATTFACSPNNIAASSIIILITSYPYPSINHKIDFLSNRKITKLLRISINFQCFYSYCMNIWTCFIFWKLVLHRITKQFSLI